MQTIFDELRHLTIFYIYIIVYYLSRYKYILSYVLCLIIDNFIFTGSHFILCIKILKFYIFFLICIYRKSCVMGWRLFSIVACYCDCTEMLRPFLFKYLETTASDTQRTFSGAASICLQNLRKTFKYGGRKNVPLKEEISALAVSVMTTVISEIIMTIQLLKKMQQGQNSNNLNLHFECFI